MANAERILPISVQSFEKLRDNNCVYVDKTEYIYSLAHGVSQFFLSRPRRFGKSLFLSTIRAYWEGRKELFQGLAIEKLEDNNAGTWKQYPVFYFDFNGRNYNNPNALEELLSSYLDTWEKLYEPDRSSKSLEERFQNILIKATQKTGLRCVILVDEYDKPLLELIDKPELQEHNKEVFKGFFSNLKKCDDYIRFVFITGVTKFHKVSIFSDLNQLKDISLNKEYSGICGITGDEVRKYFDEEIKALADEQNISVNDCIDSLKRYYDGYHFHPDGVSVYNPFSLLNAFSDREFGSYWFETGTPTYLVSRIKQSRFDLKKFTNRTIYASDSVLKDYTGDNLDLLPMLYQTGYLTICDYDKRRKRYTLCFPNEEVKYGFLESLMPSYVPKATAGNGLDIFTLDEYVENGELDGIKNVLTALFANITYTTENDPFEHYFQSVIYLVFTLLGRFAACEMHTYSGRIDCKVETGDFIYLFEFKRNDSAKEALRQIDTKDYALSFVADSRKLFKIGVSFDSKTRKLNGWETLVVDNII